MIKPSQIRMARAALKMSLKEFADVSGISFSTMQRIESSDGAVTATRANINSVRRVLEEAGIFLFDKTYNPGDDMNAGSGIRFTHWREEWPYGIFVCEGRSMPGVYGYALDNEREPNRAALIRLPLRGSIALEPAFEFVSEALAKHKGFMYNSVSWYIIHWTHPEKNGKEKVNLFDNCDNDHFKGVNEKDALWIYEIISKIDWKTFDGCLSYYGS